MSFCHGPETLAWTIDDHQIICWTCRNGNSVCATCYLWLVHYDIIQHNNQYTSFKDIDIMNMIYTLYKYLTL